MIDLIAKADQALYAAKARDGTKLWLFLSESLVNKRVDTFRGCGIG